MARTKSKMASILDDISAALPKMPAKLACAARYAIDNPEQIALVSMRGVASNAGVAPPTMQRLAHHFGFGAYEAFRDRFREELLITGFGWNAAALRAAATDKHSQTLPDRIALAARANIDAAFVQNDDTAILEMARRLSHARTTFVSSSGAVRAVADYLVKSGAMILPKLRSVDETSASTIETISTIGEGDALFVVSVTPYAQRSVHAARYARDCGADVLALTDRRSSPLVEFANVALIVPTESPHYYPSMIALIALIEAILSTVVAECDDGALDRIRRFEALRNQTDAYLK